MPLTEIAAGVPFAGGIATVPAASIQYVVVVPVLVVCTDADVISTVAGVHAAGGSTIVRVGTTSIVTTTGLITVQAPLVVLI